NKTLVKIPVVVSDREGRRIGGLKKEDFSVFQNDAKQNIVSFGTEDEPVSVALLIDTSGSTQEVLDKIKNAAKDFIDLLNPRDKCLIATFDSQINVLNSFTSDRQSLKNSLDRIQTAEKDGTIMFSAIDQIIQNSFARVKGRKAIVLLSDGKDYGSAVSKGDLLNNLNETDVSIYPIYYQSGTGFKKPVVTDNGAVVEGSAKIKPEKPVKPKKRKKVYTVLIPLPADTYTPEEIKLMDRAATTDAITTLKQISDLTYGRFYLSDSSKLNSIFKQVAAELRQQYYLGFYADGVTDKGVARGIRVKVNRPNVVVQTATKLSVQDQ
ncbi:MAG: VWA domain-containing protein, partial [Pyrinomonadaceae bacterium]